MTPVLSQAGVDVGLARGDCRPPAGAGLAQLVSTLARVTLPPASQAPGPSTRARRAHPAEGDWQLPGRRPVEVAQRSLFSEYQRFCLRADLAVLAVDGDTVITNEHLRLILDPADREALVRHAIGVVRALIPEESGVLELPSGCTVALSSAPVLAGQRPVAIRETGDDSRSVHAHQPFVHIQGHDLGPTAASPPRRCARTRTAPSRVAAVWTRVDLLPRRDHSTEQA